MIQESLRTEVRILPGSFGPGLAHQERLPPQWRQGRGHQPRRGQVQGPGRGYCGRVTDRASRRVRLGRKGADPSDPHLAAGEGSQAVDGITRARVAPGLRLDSHSVRSAQSAAHTASTRRSSSLSVKAPGWRSIVATGED